MLVLVEAVQTGHLGVFIPVLIFGVVVGVFGHIIRSRTLILAGIIVIGGASAYFTFVLGYGSR